MITILTLSALLVMNVTSAEVVLEQEIADTSLSMCAR